MQTKAWARLLSRHLYRPGPCPGFLPVAADLAGTRVPAVLPVGRRAALAERMLPAAVDGRPPHLGHAEPLALLVAAPDVRPAARGVVRLAEAASALDVRLPHRASAARSEQPEAEAPSARLAALGAARLGLPKAPDGPVAAQRGLRATVLLAESRLARAAPRAAAVPAEPLAVLRLEAAKAP